MPHVVLYLSPDARSAPVFSRKVANAGAVPRVGDRVEVPMTLAWSDSGAWGEVESVTWSQDLEVAGVTVVVPAGRVRQGSFDTTPAGWTRA